MIRKAFYLVLIIFTGIYPLVGQTTTVFPVRRNAAGQSEMQTPTPDPNEGELQFPIRAAFYYPWFPEAWDQQGMKPFTHYHPDLGYYSQNNLSVIEKQIVDMQYGKIEAGIASWWGQGQTTDKRFASLLKVGEKMGFYWAVYMESEGAGNPSVDAIRSDLTYIHDHYVQSPAYLKVSGRFVVFVYGTSGDSCDMAMRWTQANTVGAYLVLKEFPGHLNCAAQPDGWHQYAPAIAEISSRHSSFTVSPGFWKGTEAQPRLPRDINQWEKDIRDMVASKADFQLITTFNEWGEGTAVEPARQWKSATSFGAYLDVLHYDGNMPSTGLQLGSSNPSINCDQQLEYYLSGDNRSNNQGHLVCFTYFGFVTGCQCGSF